MHPRCDRRSPLLVLSTALLLAFLVACGTGPAPDDDGDGDDGNGNGSGNELEESLERLGVDIDRSDRVGPDGETLPESFRPMGASASFGHAEEFSDDGTMHPTDELFVLGSVVDEADTDGRLAVVEKEGVEISETGGVEPGTTEVLQTLSEDDNPWFEEPCCESNEEESGQALRAATAGDVDGDGFEEIVIAFVDTSSTDAVVMLEVVDDAEAGFDESAAEVVADGDGVRDISVTTADLNGDGTAQIVVAASDDAGADLLFLEGSPGTYDVDDARTKRLEGVITGSADHEVTVEMASGRFDYDGPEELAVVVNELNLADAPATGRSQYFIFDDGEADLAQLATNDIGGTGEIAEVADLASGDVDGDGLDEVVLGGLTEFHDACSAYEGVLTVLDDAEQSFESLESTLLDLTFTQSTCPAGDPWQLRFLHVNTVDLDGDGTDEIQAGPEIFASLADGGLSEPIRTLPDDVFFEDNEPVAAALTTNASDIAVGDVTGDGRENLLIQHVWRPDVRIWGLSSVDTIGDDGFAELSRVGSADDQFNAYVPSLVPANVDSDGTILKYSGGEYEGVGYTEPMIIAALAAAPCAEGIGQNLDACSTSYGDSESTTVSSEYTVTYEAGAYGGVKLGGDVPAGGEATAEIKLSVTASMSKIAGDSYTLAKSRVFTTGPLEDAVVFTSIPYDIWLYEIVAHPDPDMVGATVEVAAPREPIVLKAEREFFNENIAGQEPIGSNVFDHTVGDLSSYPTAEEKGQMITTTDGLQNGPLTVGQGTGSEGLGIAVGESVSEGETLGISTELSVDLAVGPELVVALAGFSVGYGEETNVTVTSGTETRYDATVGDLSAETFEEHAYAFGIFTYVQELDDQEFHVINYWVD